MSARNTSSRFPDGTDASRGGRQPGEFLNRAFPADAPAAEQHKPVAKTRRVADLMNREKERSAPRRVRSQCRGDVARLTQIQTLERLVDQQRRLPREQANPQKGALSLAFGERADRLPQQAAQIKLIDHFVAQLRSSAKKPDSEIECPPHGLRRPWSDTVGNVKQQRRSFACFHRPAASTHRAAFERQNTRQALEQRRLAGPVGTDQPEHLARTYLKLTSDSAAIAPKCLESPVT